MPIEGAAKYQLCMSYPIIPARFMHERLRRHGQLSREDFLIDRQRDEDDLHLLYYTRPSVQEEEKSHRKIE